MVKENATTVTLTGSEVTVEFDKNYTYFWVNNIGESAVYVSMKSGVAADKDGVVTVLSGTAAGTMHGYGADKLYLNGSGKVQIIGTYSAFCPFKVGVKGGDSGGTSEFSAAGSATQPVYFDANGRPVAISHTIEADVPANAVFTDTKYDDTGISSRVAEIEADLGGHTVKSDVPQNAVFTDTVYNDTEILKRVTDLETDLGGHSVKSDVPENAVFTDTTYSLSASNNTITLTDSNGVTSLVYKVILAETIRAAAGETIDVIPSIDPNKKTQLKILAAYDASNGKHEYAWFDGTLTAIGDSTISGFTKSTSYGYTTVSYTAPSSANSCTVTIFDFI